MSRSCTRSFAVYAALRDCEEITLAILSAVKAPSVEPRSGGIYVAQRVSAGKRIRQKASRGAAASKRALHGDNIDHRPAPRFLDAAAPRLVFCPMGVPSAYALGQVDVAAPRLDVGRALYCAHDHKRDFF